MQFEGIVGKVLSRDVNTRKGKMTFYSVKLETADDWIGLGRDKPTTFAEGDNVRIEAEKNDRGYYEATGITVLPPPARKGHEGASGSAGNSGGAAQTDLAAGVGRGAGADRQTSIVLQHSQEMAISAVALLLSNDALPVTKAATKAGEAKRFDEIVAAIDKLTVKYFRDAETGRLLEAVADMGVIDLEPDAPIPGPGKDDSDEDDE